MSRPVTPETQRNVVGIGAQIAAMLAVILLLAPLFARSGSAVDYPEPSPMASPGEPIPYEADVFRTGPSDLAVAPATDPQRPARQRTIESSRSLRAYPGAPPRIPHELTADEFRLTTCAPCHRRGGYAARFGAFAPLTPHPEYQSCLQCHAVQETLASFVGSDWQAVVWPAIGGRAMEGSPPWVPHGFQLRGNCLTCHAGPGAVVEIRTTHPERANCRQCHVPTEAEDWGATGDVFTRELDGANR